MQTQLCSHLLLSEHPQCKNTHKPFIYLSIYLRLVGKSDLRVGKKVGEKGAEKEGKKEGKGEEKKGGKGGKEGKKERGQKERGESGGKRCPASLQDNFPLKILFQQLLHSASLLLQSPTGHGARAG